MKPKKVK